MWLDHSTIADLAAAASTNDAERVAYRAASPHRYSWVRSSSATFASSGRSRSLAVRVSVSWAGRLAPSIAEVMPGLARTQATDRVASDVSSSEAIWANRSMVSNALVCQ